MSRKIAIPTGTGFTTDGSLIHYRAGTYAPAILEVALRAASDDAEWGLTDEAIEVIVWSGCANLNAYSAPGQTSANCTSFAVKLAAIITAATSLCRCCFFDNLAAAGEVLDAEYESRVRTLGLPTTHPIVPLLRPSQFFAVLAGEILESIDYDAWVTAA
jgi:hypothetical protein